MLNTIPLATNQALFDKLSWDPVKDFAPIGMVATAPHVLVVPPKVKAASVADLVKLARASPGRLTYASAGVGTTFHLCGEMFKDSPSTFILHVPYRGGGPALLDTLGGQVDMSFPTLSAAAREIRQPACARRDRYAALIAPSGRADAARGRREELSVHAMARALAPAGTPKDIVGRQNAALGDTLNSRCATSSGSRGSTPSSPRRRNRQVHRRSAALRQAHQDAKNHRGISMDLGLKNQKVLITGSKGIGLACARVFLAEGAQVALVSRSQENLNAAQKELGNVYTIAVDLTDAIAAAAMVDRVEQEFGALDVLVNSAGAAKRTDADDLTPAAWRAGMDAKYFSYINVMDPVIKRMGKRGHGAVINVIGSGGKVASPTHLPAAPPTRRCFSRPPGSPTPMHRKGSGSSGESRRDQNRARRPRAQSGGSERT